MTEAKLQRIVMAKLKARGNGEWFLYPRTRYARAGVSDIIGCYRSLAVAIELKPPDDFSYDVTPTQKAFLARFKAAGGTIVIARGWDIIAEALDRLDAWCDGE